MRPNRSVLAIAVVSTILAASAMVGCNGPTSPYGGGSTGGSGSGGTAFNSGSLNAPASYVHVFASAGSVGYHCNFHRSMGMTGDVSVVAGAADSAVVMASGTSFTPATVSIKPGGYVHWMVTSGTHTVTSD
jgi:plastocyanin